MTAKADNSHPLVQGESPLVIALWGFAGCVDAVGRGADPRIVVDAARRLEEEIDRRVHMLTR